MRGKENINKKGSNSNEETIRGVFVLLLLFLYKEIEREKTKTDECKKGISLF